MEAIIGDGVDREKLMYFGSIDFVAITELRNYTFERIKAILKNK
ncbi:MAG TPA: hypothetical protein PLA73_08805 [Sedimentibacter sp.]|jgi:hypothetical protein|nr:hypothetical protein [Sedimentibacter sp.]